VSRKVTPHATAARIRLIISVLIFRIGPVALSHAHAAEADYGYLKAAAE
jgi:hypothetical protein